MADIFISYCREDKHVAHNLDESFEKHGWTVWWDHDLHAGGIYSEVIAQQLADAQCVIVLWSKQSVESDWVKDEANVGKRKKILIPILIESVDLPLGFGQIQAADLTDWKGDDTNENFIQLLSDISLLIKKPVLSHEAIAGTTTLEHDHSATPLANDKKLQNTVIYSMLALAAFILVGLSILVVQWFKPNSMATDGPTRQMPIHDVATADSLHALKTSATVKDSGQNITTPSSMHSDSVMSADVYDTVINIPATQPGIVDTSVKIIPVKADPGIATPGVHHDDMKNVTNYVLTVGKNKFNYTGKLINGRANDSKGIGVYAFGKYTGGYVNNLRTGKGMQTWKSGDAYTGQWKSDNMYNGTYTFHNGDRYIGSYNQYGKSGKGKYIARDSTSVYNGNWKNNKRDGRGTISRKNLIYFDGLWKNDSLLKGKYFYPNGDTYDGDFKNDMRSGYGIFISKASRLIWNCRTCLTYQGYWKDDKKNGKGKVLDASGNIHNDGNWLNEKYVGK